ncbi:hypothetical protein EMIHUDRAFT_248449 [Emiliania huxleyi CCMP1516]|uniref:ASPIC/UnbV domain-containing protein n=2 Tax=Emiliania huxleyi TaxID=2903 RepID=A0A0D3IGD8_EMIH1|nr:hypothetical protein EMIHUDRAFT_248449 [Emiliania huxleyi CCMP1516]EOD10323.1 hypothetical protein EMIHUDRAFT_248449 [Emiliania huxleyi CCMP1516]|eukprot:XP_005762752.1 hypothetical protein EMIHUDRAFT_248449 [Emiliania huxleyi CCMP1516]
MLPAEPNCLHSTRQCIHSRELKSNFHSMRLAPDCELGERGRRATSRLSSARARSPELGAAGGHGQQRFDASLSVQEGTAVEVQWPSGARTMGYSFIGSYQSASGALPFSGPAWRVGCGAIEY